MFYLGWHLNFKYLEARAYLNKVLAFIFTCPWTVACKSHTIQQQIVTVAWLDLDVQDGSNSTMYLCKLKFYTVSYPVHGFVESTSFVGFTGGLQQFCCWNIFSGGGTHCVFSICISNSAKHLPSVYSFNVLSKYHLPEKQSFPWGSRAVGTAVAVGQHKSTPGLLWGLGPGQAMPPPCDPADCSREDLGRGM